MKTFKQFLYEEVSSAYHKSLDVHPGKEFHYVRNTISSKKYTKHIQGDPYKQKIEPAGRYMQAINPEHAKDLPSHMETGKHTFQNPLYIHWGSGSYEHPDNWKNVLHSHYKKRGKALSKAIVKDGYDGIVTVGHHPTMPHYTSEIVDLTMFK